ncbi:MAG: PQQ-dependent sugar dehydrogenase, partial [Flavobacteriales bacterium]
MKPILTCLLLLSMNILYAQTPSDLEIDLELFASGLDNPVGIYHAGDDRLFILEQDDGHIEIVNSDGTLGGTFLDVSGLISNGSERGLLGLAFHPDYQNNGEFFINYTNNAGNTVIAEYTVSADPNVANTSGLPLMTIVQDFGNHNGGHIAFGPDGYLYIGMGDGGSGGDPNNRAQSDASLLGKMLRIDVDNGVLYAIPSDNPVNSDPSYTNIPEAWAKGLRNPWKFSFDEQTGDLWIGDVGQVEQEEIDVVPAGTGAGLNFGWRCYEGDDVYDTAGCSGIGNYEFPVSDYSHGSPYFFCSITGGLVYRGTEFPRMNGHYFFTDYCAGTIYSLKDDGGSYVETEVNSTLGFGSVSFGNNQNGDIFLSRLNGDIFKLNDANGDFNPMISDSGNGFIASDAGVNYYWYLNGNLVVGANGQNYTPTVAGTYYAVVENSDGFSAQTNSLNWIISGGVAGCTYETAENYDENSSIDDGSCIFIPAET